jgi:cysteine desulfurase
MTETTAIYLDYNASTPLLPEALDAMIPYLRGNFGNPSSDHASGHRARAAVEHARERVAAFLGCDAGEIVFTSGGTEANNLAIRGAAEAVSDRRGVITSTIEHPATEESCNWLGRHGWTVAKAGVDASGVVRVGDVRNALSLDTALVTVMHANGETGVLQPVAEIVEAAHAFGSVVHTDAAQSIGKVRVNVRELGVDLLSLAGQKVYAPKGVGALYIKRGTRLDAVLAGAGHERGLRPGTENVAAIVGLGVALEHVGRDLETAAARMRELRDDLWRRLADRIPGMHLNGDPRLRLPNTLNVRLPGVSARALLRSLPEIEASSGSACHAGDEAPSPVLTAMGLLPDETRRSIRISIGRFTTGAETARAAEILADVWETMTA